MYLCVVCLTIITYYCIVFTAGVGNAVASTDLVCDLIAKVIHTACDVRGWADILN